MYLNFVRIRGLGGGGGGWKCPIIIILYVGLHVNIGTFLCDNFFDHLYPHCSSILSCKIGSDLVSAGEDKIEQKKSVLLKVPTPHIRLRVPHQWMVLSMCSCNFLVWQPGSRKHQNVLVYKPLLSTQKVQILLDQGV